jgi:hypothetical protein
MSKIIKVQRDVNPINHLTIIKRGEDNYTINVTSGSIENPSKRPDATWYDLHGGNHTLDEVKEICRSCGINDNIDSLINN